VNLESLAWLCQTAKPICHPECPCPPVAPVAVTPFPGQDHHLSLRWHAHTKLESPPLNWLQRPAAAVLLIPNRLFWGERLSGASESSVNGRVVRSVHQATVTSRRRACRWRAQLSAQAIPYWLRGRRRQVPAESQAQPPSKHGHRRKKIRRLAG